MACNFISTKVLELGSCAFRQWRASLSHCHFIHGYQLKAKFWFGAEVLDGCNWVVDFGGLKGLERKLKDQFDHTLCVAGDDPALPLLKELHSKDVVDLRVMEGGVGIENTAKFVYQLAQSHIDSMTNGRCKVLKVEVFEHENNSAMYVPDLSQKVPTDTFSI